MLFRSHRMFYLQQQTKLIQRACLNFTIWCQIQYKWMHFNKTTANHHITSNSGLTSTVASIKYYLTIILGKQQRLKSDYCLNNHLLFVVFSEEVSSLMFPLVGGFVSSSGIARAEEYCLILKEMRMLDTIPNIGNK